MLKLHRRFNEVICLEFDLACSERLIHFDADRETAQLEAMTGATLTKELGPILGKPEVRTITQADIGDQGI